MSPSQQLQRLLAEIHAYEAVDLIRLLPLSAALQSAIYARILILQNAQLQAAVPDTDYLLSIDEIAPRIGKSTRWIRDNIESLPFALHMGKEHRFSVRLFDEWIKDQRDAKIRPALPSEGGPT